MAAWHAEASRELKQYARSGQRGAGKKAGDMYEFAKLLTLRRASKLPRVGRGMPDIRWWDCQDMTIYMRVDPAPIMVVKVGRTKTPQQRKQCETDARTRS